jgi:hypothetical protein
MPEPLSSTNNQRPKLLGGITGKGFMPGQSGCPGGRPRQDVTELARAHTADAIRALVLALQSPRERVPAAVALLDRGWGRPVQMISGDAKQPLLVDFRWASDPPPLALPISAPVIEAAAEPGNAEDDDQPETEIIWQLREAAD